MFNHRKSQICTKRGCRPVGHTDDSAVLAGHAGDLVAVVCRRPLNICERNP